MSSNKHTNDDGRELFEIHGDSKVPFTDEQRFLHFDFIENKTTYFALKSVTARKSAYKAESDPLYMEWQFDQTLESENAWRDKVAEIKLRYPLITNS